MKNYKPIKRHQAIVSFSQDHHFGLLLVWKIKHGLANAIKPERISNYAVYFFRNDLEKHFREEEQFLFCKLPADDSLRKRAESEHLAIYAKIAVIEKKKNDATLLNQLADMLEKHIRFEERELFTHLQSNLTSAELQSIASRYSNNSQQVDEKWKDVFWAFKPGLSISA